MAVSQTAQIALAVTFFGSLSFVLGIFAELKKPPFGTPIQGRDVVICKYPSDPTVALGVLSVAAVLISAGLGVLSIYFPHKGKSVPKDALHRSTILVVFFTIAVGVTVLGVGLMLWATFAEGLHRIHNVHHNLEAECATAKTGLFGGAAFMALNAALFWLVCQMLATNAKEDYLDYDEDDTKGEYGQVLTTDYEVIGDGKPQVR